MKLNGEHKFKVKSQQVFSAILNTEVLEACIPGCNSVEYLDPVHIRANVTTPLPGLRGPYGAVIEISELQAPNTLVLELHRKGAGGSVNFTGHINIAEEADGTLLSYTANADLTGPIAIVNNPIGQGIVRNSLGTFFKNLEKNIAYQSILES